MISKSLRLLAIDLTGKGFGFVLLDAQLGLLDWGFCCVRSKDDDAFMERVKDRIDRGQPTVLVFENFAPVKARRNALKRLGLVMQLVTDHRLGICQVSRKVVQRVLGLRTKDEIAQALAARFPELQSRVPPERERWMQEADRMHIFDALSFGLAIMDPILAPVHRHRNFCG
jgi:hypothetical protein